MSSSPGVCGFKSKQSTSALQIKRGGGHFTDFYAFLKSYMTFQEQQE